MSSQFTDQQITNWAQLYEREICAKEDLLCDRISLAISSGINEYELPSFVTNIRSVLYLGREIHPKGFRAAVMTGDTPFQTAGALPFEYIFSGKGQRVIKLLPSPNEDIALYTGDLWTADADRYGFIVEFYRTPDYSANPQLVLPTWVRQYLLKDHVCWKAFQMEGPQQDSRAAGYYQGRLNQGVNYVREIKENMNKAQINVLYKNQFENRRKPGHPVLPPNFGFKVNW